VEALATAAHVDKRAVVMSLDTKNSLMETVHLLRSPANAAHLQRSLEQAWRGDFLEHGLIDGDPGLPAPRPVTPMAGPARARGCTHNRTIRRTMK
jgi:hypothetical protein